MIENWREKELESQQLFNKRLMYFLQNDEWAVKFCMDLLYISHLWDDLIDKDKERTNEEINDAFRIALIDIPLNPFFQNNRIILLPLIQNTILTYETANKIEKETGSEIAFWLRNAMLNIFGMAIFLVGGMEWYRKVSAEFYTELWKDLPNLLNVFKGEFGNG